MTTTGRRRAAWKWAHPQEQRLAVDEEICFPVMWALDHQCYIRVLYTTRKAAMARNAYKYGGSGTISKVRVSVTQIRAGRGGKRGRG